MTSTGVSSFWRFEDALTKHYLGIDGPEGSAPLEFLDTSARRLSVATGIPETQVMDAFLSTFTRSGLVDAFSHGSASRPPAGLIVPGYLNYLVLTCFVASVSPEDAEQGQFHRRLQEVLRFDRGISGLSGIAELWEKLRDWCADRHEVHHDMRRIVLPDPGNMNRIGYSVRISFPSRHDLGRMERLFGSLLRRSHDDPSAMLPRVRAELGRFPWSQGFVRAFDDFDRRHRAGERLLADHPFWLGLVGLPDRAEEASEREREFLLEFTVDLDGRPSYYLTASETGVLGAFDLEGGEGYGDGNVDLEVTPSQMLSTIAKGGSYVSKELAACHAEGVIPFSETRWGVWRAERDPSAAQVRLLLRDGVLPEWKRDRSPDGWCLLAPIPLADAGYLLRSVRKQPHLVTGTVTRLMVRGGIRVGRAYLGRPRHMPFIDAVVGCHASAVPIGEVLGEVLARPEGARVVLECRSSVEGSWRVPVSEAGAVKSTPLVVFERYAQEMPLPDLAALGRKWRDDEPALPNVRERSVTREPSGGTEDELGPPDEFDDLLEAVYAGGSTGWSEKSLVPMVSAALPDGSSGAAVWDVLRLLDDSGWLIPRVSRHWRARKWFPAPCRLLSFGESAGVLLDGAAPTVLRRRFRETVTRLGGRVTTRTSEKGWCVPTDFADDVEPDALARAMRLPLSVAAAALPEANGPLTFSPSVLTDRTRMVRSRWNWSNGRFSRFSREPTSDVMLECLETAKPNAADLYRISKDGRTEFLCDGRSTAILEAHRLAGRAMFEIDDGDVLRTTQEGGLPAEVARYLRLRTGRGPYLVLGQGRTGYRYACHHSDVAMLGRLLGDAFRTIGESTGPDLLRVMAIARVRGRAGAVVAELGWRAPC